jgi:hypothetical protein
VLSSELPIVNRYDLIIMFHQKPLNTLITKSLPSKRNTPIFDVKQKEGSNRSMEEVKCVVKEDWSFFNILCILEGGNEKYLKFSNKEIPGSTSHSQEEPVVVSNNAALLAAYRATLSKCVSKTFGYLGTVPYTR